MSETKNKGCQVSSITLQQIKEEIEKIQFGSVTIVVHEGKIVQIDTSTKKRLQQFGKMIGKEGQICVV